jgi:hypothetical protein
MPQLEKPVKLKRGTIAKIALRLKLNATHIYLVAKAERPGNTGLIRALKIEERKQSRNTSSDVATLRRAV